MPTPQPPTLGYGSPQTPRPREDRFSAVLIATLTTGLGSLMVVVGLGAGFLIYNAARDSRTLALGFCGGSILCGASLWAAGIRTAIKLWHGNDS